MVATRGFEPELATDDFGPLIIFNIRG